MASNNVTRVTVGLLETNCWIYRLDEKTAAIIDPGAEAEEIIAALEKLDLTPKYILLTHGHFDHIAAVPELVSAFPHKIEIAIHRLDCECLGKDAYAVHSDSIKAVMGSTQFLDLFWNDMPPADRLLKEGDAIGPFTVLSLPGHTQGSVAFWDKKEGVLFSGDTLFEGTYGRTDLSGGSDDEIFASLRRLFAMDGNISVYPGHGNATTIGREAGRGMIG